LKHLALLVIVGVVLLLSGVAVGWFGLHEDAADNAASPMASSAAGGDIVERGHYLVTAGDCMACHSAAGEPKFAGGRRITTPFGNFFSPNITPDELSGIGLWTADDFWRALHNGKSRDGSLLYPVFPYTNYSRLQRSDGDAMYAYLRTVAPVRRFNRKHALPFPFGLRVLLAGWRALYFRPGEFVVDAGKSEEWNRGAYLVQGLGHCSACHEARNAIGGIQSRDNPAGGLSLSWYAPALSSPTEAGLQDWATEDIVHLLKDGVTAKASVLGPMAEVVFESLQHLEDQDLHAMAIYLQALPRTVAADVHGLVRVPAQEAAAMRSRGERLYQTQCAECHGEHGEGRLRAGPSLADNRAVMLGSPVNPIRITLFGGYPPGTEGNPRPYGMPAFANELSNSEVADVLTFVRSAWGDDASAVSPIEVDRNSGSPLW